MPNYCGRRLFELKATHGIPLDISVEKIHGAGVAIEWTEFIKAARSNGWWDFRTIVVIEQALSDSITSRKLSEEILKICKIFIMNNPLK